jgi:hypothetical protein
MHTPISRRRLFTALGLTVGSAVVAESLRGGPAAAVAGNAASVQLTNPPFRIIDTRDPSSTKLVTGNTLDVFVPGLLGAGVVGALLNVTITNTEGAGWLRLDASNSTAANNTSNINWWTSGLTLANLAAVPAEGTRGVTVTAGGSGRVDVIIDLVGLLTNP